MIRNMKLGPENATWDDGEWVSWSDINNQIRFHEWRVKYPNGDLSVIDIFEELIQLAEKYYFQTSRHLNVFGDIGELYAQIKYGMILHKNYAQGSDGRLGKQLIEVKTISPLKKTKILRMSLKGNFNQLLLVRINEEYELKSVLIPRNELPIEKRNSSLTLNWTKYL